VRHQLYSRFFPLFLVLFLSSVAPAIATAPAKTQAYRAVDTIGAAAESAINWFTPAAHIYIAMQMSYRLVSVLINRSMGG
jgi:hypothetical protein